LLTTLSFTGCVAVGMTLITISGNIMSFSLGVTVAASSIAFIAAANWAGIGWGLAAGFAMGGLVTGAQGFVIGRLGANPIIVSIAVQSLAYGLSQGIIHNATFYASDATGQVLLHGKIAGVPIEFVLFLCVVGVGQFILSFTRFGRNLYMVGSSPRAAEAAGVRTWRAITGAYFWAGMFTALSGILLASRYTYGNMTYGAGYDYDAIAAVLVGGTAIQGGQGSVLRTLSGIMIIAILQDVLLLQGMRLEWRYLITGIVVLAVIMAQTRGARR
jgi:ribose/xylose/arabinose/galactoside ABC-type transport system permease subunit